jgi:serine/threonine-protein kinase HipA
MMNKFSLLHLHTTQGYAGELRRESQHIFNYRTDDAACELSLTMPLTAKSYAASILPGVLRQNLPEGYLKNWMQEHFGKTLKLDDFNMLAITGAQMIGRINISQQKEKDDALLAGENLSELLAWKGTEALFEHLAQKYAAMSGISGVQPKVLMPAKRSSDDDSDSNKQRENKSGTEVVEKATLTDRHLIVKAAGHDYPGLAENEFHCMTIAKQAGLIVPDFWLSDDKGLFVTSRFDRDAQSGYLGFEDMTALTGRQNEEKYTGSYEMIATAIATFASPQFVASSLEEFFKSVVLSVVVRNGDAHLKNFGLLYTHPRSDDVRLSPLFDIVNTTSYLSKDTLALKLAKTKSWPYRKELTEFGKKACRVDKASEIIDQIVDAAANYTSDIKAGEIWMKVKAEIDRSCLSFR